VITSATDPNGFVTRATYDGLSRPTSSTPALRAFGDGAPSEAEGSHRCRIAQRPAWLGSCRCIRCVATDHRLPDARHGASYSLVIWSRRSSMVSSASASPCRQA